MGAVSGTVQSISSSGSGWDRQTVGYILVTGTDMLVFFNVRNRAPGDHNAFAVGSSVTFDFAHKSTLQSKTNPRNGQVTFASVDGGPAGVGQAINISVI